MVKYVATPFVAGTPQAEVIGQTVLAFAQNLEADTIAPLLPKYGLDNIDPEKWYPHQAWMNILKELSEMPDGATGLVAFGRKVVETAMMPPEIDTIPKMLEALHAIHHLNLRHVPEEEGYSLEKLGEKHYIVYQNTPNPDDAIYGFLWGLAARFKAPGEQFVVRKIENTKPEQYSGSAFEVKWGSTYEKL
jgi:hypothetical protein